MATCSPSTSGGGGAAMKAAANERPEIEEKYWSSSDKAMTSGLDAGFAYHGDGKETVDFFKNNSNYDELISKMSRSERDAFEAWVRGEWMGGEMYEDFSKLSPSLQEYIRTYDKILDKAELKTGITVARLSTAELIFGKGKTHATLEELQAAKGKIVNCKGCLSTGVASEGLTIGARIGSGLTGKSIEYSIKIPPGKGRGMWIGDSRINPGWGAKQREFMTNRDAMYKVGKTTYDKKRNVYKVEITMVGKTDHDYS